MPPPTARMPLAHGSAANRPDRIVVHCMGEFIERGDQDLSAHGLLDELGLSVHALVTPSGVVIRCRDDDQGGYHARSYNRNSLGVEFLVPGVHTYSTFVARIGTPYLTEVQYESGRDLLRNWIETFAIAKERVQRHSDVDPDRKVDPGEGFPWTELLDELYA